MRNQEFTYNRFECILNNEGKVIEKKHGVNTPKTVRITEKEANFMNSQIQDTWILFEKVEEKEPIDVNYAEAAPVEVIELPIPEEPVIETVDGVEIELTEDAKKTAKPRSRKK